MAARRVWFPITFLPKSIRARLPVRAKVRDATASLVVKLSPDDNRRAKKKDAQSCAMAQACSRQEGADLAIVQLRHAYLVKGNRIVRYGVPESVRREIVSFDRHKDFQPGLYRLSAVIPSAKLGAPRATKPKTGPRKTTKKSSAKMIRHHTVGTRPSEKVA